MTWQTRRRKPYLEENIHRMKCIRCGAVAHFQWQICSDGNNFRPLCRSCDFALNRLVLEWMKHPHAAALMVAYERANT